jgi:exodeoxyribonuclease VII small subunit
LFGLILGKWHLRKSTGLHNFCWTFLAGSSITIELGAIPLVKFEECLERLERIVHELEKGEVPLEKSLTLFEEGMQLSATCKKQLEEAEGRVEILLKQNGKLQSEPFEPRPGKWPANKAFSDSELTKSVLAVRCRSHCCRNTRRDVRGNIWYRRE